MTARHDTLRNLLLFDATTCAAMGIALLIAAGWLAGLTGIPATLLTWAGAVLLPIAAFMAFVATRTPIPAAGTLIIVAGNLGWFAASVALMMGPWIAPNALGQAFIGAQALVVLVLAALEYLGLRGRAATAAA